MGRHFNIFLWILLLKSTKGQILYDDLYEKQQNTLNSAMYFFKNELEESVEKMLLQNLEEIEDNLQKKIDKRIENLTKSLIENFTNIMENELACYRELTLLPGSDCADIFKRCPNTRGKDGLYNIMDVTNKIKSVYCDMTTDNAGWTVIHRRINGSVDFYRNWMEYKNGFGFVDHEYWIGNDMLHKLSSMQPQELRVDIERFNGEKAYAVYSNFSVGDETSKYKLEVNGYSGTAGDSLAVSNNMKFSTPDQDNDGTHLNCVTSFRSVGWFDWCFHANPNGQYTNSEIADPKYISWFHFKNSYISLKSMKLMIRPRP